MSRENVEIVRRMYEAYLAGDIDRALEYFHPDVTADFTVRGDTGVRMGREALSETVATWVGAWDDYSERIDGLRDLGDTVCVFATQRGRGKGSGVEIDNQFAQLYELEDGLITSITMYASPARALEAAGLSEQAMSQENVEVIRAVYDRYREGDFQASATLLDRHVVLVLEKAGDWGLEIPESGRYVGRDAVAAYTRDLVRAWDRFTMEAEEIVRAGDSVLVSVRQHGVGSASGVPSELRYFTLWSFRGPKVIRIESFREHQEALEAAGLSAARPVSKGSRSPGLSR